MKEIISFILKLIKGLLSKGVKVDIPVNLPNNQPEKKPFSEPEPSISTEGNPIKEEPVSKKIALMRGLKVVIENRFDPLIVYTHAYHETGNFLSMGGEYNYFGMKPPSSVKPPLPGWDGKIVKFTTKEVINGVEKILVDTFCDFDNAEDCLRFYIYQIQRLYKESYENRNSPQAYFYWLIKGKNQWATDKTYVEKLEKLYAHLRANGILENIARRQND